MPKKFYVAYKSTQNFVCVEAKKDKMTIFLKINQDDFDVLPSNARDVRDIDHFGTGDFELEIKSRDEFEKAKVLINKSYENIGDTSILTYEEQ